MLYSEFHSDRALLEPMGQQAKEVLSVDKLDVVADRGYFSTEQIKACADAGITPTLPNNRPMLLLLVLALQEPWLPVYW